MRPLIWALLLFAAAVAVALALANATGYVLVVWPPYRMELSLALTIVGLLTVFALAYLALRFLSQVLALPAEVKAYRARRRTRCHTDPCGLFRVRHPQPSERALSHRSSAAVTWRHDADPASTLAALVCGETRGDTP